MCVCECVYVCDDECVCVRVVADTNQILSKRKLKAFGAARETNQLGLLANGNRTHTHTHTPCYPSHTHTHTYPSSAK